jgi:CheY-like chemotaxis protein
VSLRGARILVADDQLDVARTLTEPLRAAGATLRFVSDGMEALDSIRAGGHDLLIADMKMPPHDWGGLWLLEQLKQRRYGIPCLVLTGEGQQRQTIEAMRFRGG